MERLFQILAVILAGIAAYFLWNGNNDAGFVSVVGGAVSFFLSVRFQVKERLDQRAAERLEEEREDLEYKFPVSDKENFLTADEQMKSGEKHLTAEKESL